MRPLRIILPLFVLSTAGCPLNYDIKPEPQPPVAPEQLAPFDYHLHVPEPGGDNRADMLADRVEVRAVPSTLPFPARARVVIAVPKDAVTTADRASRAATSPTKAPEMAEEMKELRASLIAAFVGRGFRVKDAGVLHLPSLSLRSHPDRKRRTTITEVRPTTDGGTRTTETEYRKDDPWAWWWASDGLKLLIEDPTSLWVTDLLDYEDLEADVFFRIFSISVERFEETATVLPFYTDAQFEAYRAQAEDARRHAQRYTEVRSEYIREVERYRAARAEYEKLHRLWRDTHAEMFRDEDAEPPRAAPAPVVTVPEPPPAFTEDALRTRVAHARRTLTVERLRVRILAEAVSGTTGDVLWVGDVSADTTLADGDSKSRRVALFQLMHKLVQEMLGR